MKNRLVTALLIGTGLYAGHALPTPSGKPNAHAAAQEPARPSSPRSSLPNVKTPLAATARSRPVTLNQVERQTGGKVIGAKPVSVQGRQLNQIKVRMPNGRIIIHQQLFDENGRSVDTVQTVDDDPGARSRSADQ